MTCHVINRSTWSSLLTQWSSDESYSYWGSSYFLFFFADSLVIFNHMFGPHWSGCDTYRKVRQSNLSLVKNSKKWHIKMDYPYMVIVAAAALCIYQLLAACMVIFENDPTASEAIAAKRHRHELTPYKRNFSMMYGQPTTNLEHVPHLEWCELTIHKGCHSPSRMASARSVRWIITSAYTTA